MRTLFLIFILAWPVMAQQKAPTPAPAPAGPAIDGDYLKRLKDLTVQIDQDGKNLRDHPGPDAAMKLHEDQRARDITAFDAMTKAKLDQKVWYVNFKTMTFEKQGAVPPPPPTKK